MRKNKRKMFNGKFNSIVEVMQVFSTEEKCIQHLEELYWQGNPVSPFIEGSKVYKCKGGKYKCKESGKYFSVLTGTMFAGTKIDLPLWFCAVYLIINHKKGLSSAQLGRDLNISQKSAWLMLQRIRKCFGIENNNDLYGVVEADESFYGGLNKNRHEDKKIPHSQGRSCSDKSPILGLLQRDGKLTAIVTKDTSKESLQPVIRKYVKPGTLFITDDWKGYRGLTEYNHYVVKDYKEKVYDNTIHTNNIEGAWKIMKNTLRDMYNSIKRKYLQIYVDEFVFRYNTRTMESEVRFNYLLLNSGIRTKYKDLVNDQIKYR